MSTPSRAPVDLESSWDPVVVRRITSIIVVNSFASYYKNRLWRNEVAHKRRHRAEEQAKLVKEILISNSGSRKASCAHGSSMPPGQGGAQGHAHAQTRAHSRAPVNSLETSASVEGSGASASVIGERERGEPASAIASKIIVNKNNGGLNSGVEDRRRAFASLAMGTKRNNNSFAAKDIYLSVPTQDYHPPKQ